MCVVGEELNSSSHNKVLFCSVLFLKMTDQTLQFFHFTNIFLRAHLDDGKRKICAIYNTFTIFCIRITSGNKLLELKVVFFLFHW